MAASGVHEARATYSLTPLQQGMLFHSMYEPESGVYCEQLAITLSGALDLDAFVRAWQTVVDRHAILRTAFPPNACRSTDVTS